MIEALARFRVPQWGDTETAQKLVKKQRARGFNHLRSEAVKSYYLGQPKSVGFTDLRPEVRVGSMDSEWAQIATKPTFKTSTEASNERP